MSEQRQHPSRQSRTARMRPHETRRHDERGFITPGILLGLGKAAAAIVVLGTPLWAGASYAARDLGPNAMTGELGVTQPAKVEIEKTTIEQELCIANAIVKVSAEIGFEGHPLGADAEGNILGVPYNLNLERSIAGEVYRKVRYCIDGMDIPYTYDPNIAFGDPTRPAITAELNIRDLLVIVSALHDGRDNTYPTSDGVLGYFASDFAKYMQQKTVKDLIGKDIAQSADIQNNIDNILRGAYYAYSDREAGIACLRASKEYDWQNSPIGKLITQAGIEAIQAHFLSKDRNRPQPEASDISFKLVGSITTNPTAEILNQKENSDMESAVSLMTKPTLMDGSPRELDISGIKIPIQYESIPPRASAGTCEIKTEAEIGALTPGDKGEE